MLAISSDRKKILLPAIPKVFAFQCVQKGHQMSDISCRFYPNMLLEVVSCYTVELKSRCSCILTFEWYSCIPEVVSLDHQMVHVGSPIPGWGFISYLSIIRYIVQSFVVLADSLCIWAFDKSLREERLWPFWHWWTAG